MSNQPKKTSLSHKIQIISKLEALKELRKKLRLLFSSWSIDTSISEEIILAIEEVCSNAIKHGHNSIKTKKIDITLILKDNNLNIIVDNIGSMPKEINKHLNTTLEELVEARKKGGFGLKLIYSIMNNVKYITKDGQHSCYLSKKLR